jgi:Flp pilus assembly protein TadB
VAAPVIKEPLTRLVERLHIRVPMPDALLRFAGDLDDPGADLIIAALVINARLRGPGLRDLLGSLSASVREELDMRRKVTAERRSIRRSVQIVVGVSVGMALALALLDHSFLAPMTGCSARWCSRRWSASTPWASSGCGGWRGSRSRSGCSPPPGPSA